MNLIVAKFGGSSLVDNKMLIQAAKKIISFVEDGNKVVVILSAQGKTTDNLLKQAKELSLNPNKRELDMLLSVGEQISCSKFAILLQEMEYKAISLTGWQSGIVTDTNYTDAKIEDIYSTRIWKELDNNQIIVITGFQGINHENDITTLGRDGSDITALAITAALGLKECYTFKDIGGIYDKNPKEFTDAKKIDFITYTEMLELIKNGSKVLHERSIKIAEKYKIKINVQSSYNNEKGSIIG